MGNVTDVSGQKQDDWPVLTQTDAGGLLGGRLLHDDPLVEYLDETEQPGYVLRNKKRGLAIERDGEDERIEPHSEYNALCLATDVRLLVVVGQEPRDESVSIPLSEIVSVDVEDGMLEGELAVVTADDERYAFPCRGDVAAAAEYVDEGTQAWARAHTLLDRAEDRLEAATDLSEDASFAQAHEAVDEARDALADARDRLAAFGDGALAAIESEAEGLDDRIAERRRQVHEDHGEHALAAGREHWERREWDAAYDTYAEAEAALERAQMLREEDDTTARLDRVREEWRKLEVAPTAYAEAMAAEARETDDPATAAQCWEVALERYRDVYALDWGREERRFDVQLEGVRERVLVLLESVVDRRIEAARDARAEAEVLRETGEPERARKTLDAARDEVERTIDLVDELQQDDYADLFTEREAIEDSLAALESTESTA